MSSVEEFMQSYFAERTQLLRLHEDTWNEMNRPFYTESHLNEWKLEVDFGRSYENGMQPTVIHVANHVQSTEVITLEPDWGERKRFRYALLQNEHGWQIAQIFEECLDCRPPRLIDEHQCKNGWVAVDYCR
jgi:hypothetical protein